MKVLIVAPHPDDEVLGVGGTIAKATTAGHEVTVLIVTRGTEDLFSTELIETGRREASEAHSVLGIRRTLYLDFPAAKLDTVPRYLINKAISEVFSREMPEVVFLPFRGDIHIDHQIVFDSAMVALRPNKQNYPKKIFMYETLSETNWNDYKNYSQFSADIYIDISDHLETKLKALACFKSQMQQFPNERSLEAVHHLAKSRGATVNLLAAEAFSLVRMVIS